MHPILGTPGISDERTFNYKFVFRDGKFDPLPNGGWIDVAKSRDPFNTPAIDTLGPGLMMGQVGSYGNWAPSFFGKSTGAITGTSTTLTLSAAQATELVRRVGTSGTFKLLGSKTANTGARQLTVTFSAVDTTTGAVTITAIGVSDVWTLTAPAGQDAGMYQLEVTTGKGTSAEVRAVTAALAANANTATVDAAVEALTNVGAGGVVAVYADPTLTLTFASNLGPVDVRVLTDTTNDGGVFEGGWAAVHTTTGVDGRFVAGSLVSSPSDGSETPLSLIPHGYGITVADGTNAGTLEPWNAIPIAGIIDWNQVVPTVTDTSMRAWIKDKMTGSGQDNKFRFV
jgi:hypothetical protein